MVGGKRGFSTGSGEVDESVDSEERCWRIKSGRVTVRLVSFWSLELGIRKRWQRGWLWYKLWFLSEMWEDGAGENWASSVPHFGLGAINSVLLHPTKLIDFLHMEKPNTRE